MESKEKVEGSDLQLSITIEQDEANLSPKDLVALNKDFHALKLTHRNAQNVDNRQIEQWKKELPQLYISLYDTSIYTRIEDNSFILTYFKKLKLDDTYKGLYESLSKVYFKIIYFIDYNFKMCIIIIILDIRWSF